jgi:iron complex outermembrane receptor protein
MTRKTTYWVALAASAWLLAAAPARADEVALPEPAAPAQGRRGDSGEEPEIAIDADREIDLASVVTSAAKGVTTVQEAPAIITVVTAEEIKNRGFRWLHDISNIVPGWFTTQVIGNQVFQPLVRGQQQAVLKLQDGISMFDPQYNIAWFNQNQPVETIKRIEFVTGPGGVLWGANSFLGIMNVISKDAEDVNGLEVSAGYGDGPGFKQHFRAYAMFGKVFWGGKFKMFQHVSFDTYVGSVWNIPQFIASSPAPQPVGPGFYGRNFSPDPERSFFVNIDGKYSLGPVTLTFNIPWGQTHPQLIFANSITTRPASWNVYDRYVILDYKGRFWKDRFGITAKAYWTQFVREYDIRLFPASGLFPPFTDNDGMGGTFMNPGGLYFNLQRSFIQRTGLTLDMDLNLPKGFRLLGGGEFFFESVTGHVSDFPSPQLARDLPLLCPVRDRGNGVFERIDDCPRQFVNDTSRLVVAGYVNVQYKPVRVLTFDAGVRLQQGFGNRPYDFVPLYSGAVVWNFLPDFHLKANYATGFRAPVFNNTDAPPGGLNYGGSARLKTETSQAFQVELNARLLRNKRKIRELELRVDYSYTFLDRIIQINSGLYGNRGQRALHSVEFYGKLYLNGDHYLQASYTFLYGQAADSGVLRYFPNHWVSLGATVNVVKNMLDFNTNLLITGAFQDPNRYPSGPASIPACPAGSPGLPTCAEPTTVARTTDLTYDRLTPIALLQLGFRLRFLKEKLGVSGQFYNVLNQRYYLPDAFYDLTPSIEMTPIPAPGFNFFASVTYRP